MNYASSFSGIATHYVTSENLNPMVDALCQLTMTDFLSVNNIIEQYAADINENQINYFYSGQRRSLIDSCFASNNLKQIETKLESFSKNEDLTVKMNQLSTYIKNLCCFQSPMFRLENLLKKFYKLYRKCHQPL